VGNFLTNLRSGTKWDLIIVNTEAKERVKGELWDGILEQVVRNKAGVIAEFWYAWDIGDRVQRWEISLPSAALKFT
jgi:hypothetical protein